MGFSSLLRSLLTIDMPWHQRSVYISETSSRYLLAITKRTTSQVICYAVAMLSTAACACL